MSKQEILDLIAAKIAGQGTMVDAGSALPAILEGIIGLIPTVPEPYVLPKASAETLGGIKVGENLNIDEDGTLSVAGGCLIVEGTTDGTVFYPSEEVDTVELYNKFLAGTKIIFKVDGLVEEVIGVNGDPSDGMVYPYTKSWEWEV